MPSRGDWFDVLILGAGPAGIATALGLAERGRRVIVVGPAAARGGRSEPDPNPDPNPVAARVETVPPEARGPLRRLGLWAEFAAGANLGRAAGPPIQVRASGRLAAWGGASPATVEAITHPLGIGWHIDRAGFAAWLQAHWRRLGAWASAGSGGVDLAPAAGGWSITGLDPGSGPAAATAGRRVRAAWVVDASGRAAVLARRSGAWCERADRLVAVLPPLPATAGDPADDRSLVEAVPGGWWYSARGPTGALAVVLLTDADLAPLAGPAATRLDRLAAALREAPWTARRVGAGFAGLPEPGRLACCRAASTRLVPAVGAGWLAVGDAALACDPLAGQGVYRALLGGIAAADALDAALGGDQGLLTAYAADLDSDWAAYLNLRRAYYRRETRWPDAPFWERRRSG